MTQQTEQKMDERFRVEVVTQTPDPQWATYVALHQCYDEGFALDSAKLSEDKSGEVVVRRLLAGGRGHYGPLEAPQITFNCGDFPHSTMQQIRTHRIGVSMPTQSFRYTGGSEDGRISRIITHNLDPEDVFYLRPLGFYQDRKGRRYEYTQHHKDVDRTMICAMAELYRERIIEGFSEEHARGMIPFDVRQNWVLTCNARSLMHLFDMRYSPVAQLEAQQLCELIWPHFQVWMPAVAEWYEQNRLKKARLAP